MARADAAVGRILAAWEAALGDRTIVTVVSDHGEGRGDHGEETHGLLTYGATIDIPWVLKAEGRIPGGRIDPRPSSIVDVAPTLLSLAG